MNLWAPVHVTSLLGPVISAVVVTRYLQENASITIIIIIIISFSISPLCHDCLCFNRTVRLKSWSCSSRTVTQDPLVGSSLQFQTITALRGDTTPQIGFPFCVSSPHLKTTHIWDSSTMETKCKMLFYCFVEFLMMIFIAKILYALYFCHLICLEYQSLAPPSKSLFCLNQFLISTDKEIPFLLWMINFSLFPRLVMFDLLVTMAWFVFFCVHFAKANQNICCVLYTDGNWTLCWQCSCSLFGEF